MINKDCKTYTNEAKTKLSSVEACITEAHSMASNKNKIEFENIMKTLENVSKTLSNIEI